MKPITLVSNESAHETIVELPNGELKWIAPNQKVAIIPKQSYLEKRRPVAEGIDSFAVYMQCAVAISLAFAGDLKFAAGFACFAVLNVVVKVLKV
jgi:hypothetical protein